MKPLNVDGWMNFDSSANDNRSWDVMMHKVASFHSKYNFENVFFHIRTRDLVAFALILLMLGMSASFGIASQDERKSTSLEDETPL
ncbi:MAG TPA: hypothetical protein EYQ58_08045, partial [Candidatus Poseidoniales archaeon]|nr:hypothetical protein [Candidatus Poseidoniales archaeon]